MPIIEVQIPAKRCPRIGDAIVGVQVNLFVFDRFPFSFDEDIVAPGTPHDAADKWALIGWNGFERDRQRTNRREIVWLECPDNLLQFPLRSLYTVRWG